MCIVGVPSGLLYSHHNSGRSCPGEHVRQMNRLAPKPLWKLEEIRSFLGGVCEDLGFWQVDLEHGTY
jgi:hypothetical protein